MPRIIITGASGAGTTTLGRALAAHLGVAHVNSDDYFWLHSDPPFQLFRAGAERNSLLLAALKPHADWVLSGSISRWSCVEVEHAITHAIWLLVPTAVRLERLRLREIERFGPQAVQPGHPQYESYSRLVEWTSRYDTAGLEQRSYALHEHWLGQLGVPLLRIEGDLPTARCLARAVEWLAP